MVKEVEEPGKEYVYTIEHEINVVNLSQSGCAVNKIEERKTAREWDPRTHEQTAREWDPRTDERLVMIVSGASVNVCPKWFGNSKLEQSDVCNLSQRSKRKTAPGIRKETDLVEKLPSDETVRFPCGGRDETYPECKLFV